MAEVVPDASYASTADGARGGLVAALALATPALLVLVVRALVHSEARSALIALAVAIAAAAGGAVAGSLHGMLEHDPQAARPVVIIRWTAVLGAGWIVLVSVMASVRAFSAESGAWPSRLEMLSGHLLDWPALVALVMTATLIGESLRSDRPLQFIDPGVSLRFSALPTWGAVIAAGWWIAVPLTRPDRIAVPHSVADARRVIRDAEAQAWSRPAHAPSQIAYGAALALLERFDQAKAPLLRAHELDANDFDGVVMLVWTETQLGEFEAGLKHADRLVAGWPRYGWGHRLRGRALQGLGRDGEARAEFIASARIDSDDHSAQLEAAGAFVQTNQYEQALIYAEKATTLRPDDARAQMARAQVLRSLARFKESRDGYEAAARLVPENPSILAELAVAHYLLGDAVGAARNFARIDAIAREYWEYRPDHAAMWAEAKAGRTGEIPPGSLTSRPVRGR